MRLVGIGGLLLVSGVAGAQTCTTQAKMVSNVRETLASTAMNLATAIKNNDPGTVGKMVSTEIATNFAPTGFLVRTTSEVLTGDSLRVTQIYELDANAHAAGQDAPADFQCPLSGSGSEVDFSIPGLPAGLYSFVMVEATGERPWLLSFLLEQQGGQWKMAGFYPHARSAAGHDGLWFWNDARARQKNGQLWAAWMEFGVADDLLRPANFVGTTHLDKLRGERTSSAPPELRDGLSADTPYVLKGETGASYPVTALSAAGADDGKRLLLVMHVRTEAVADATAARARNVAAARALLVAHPELRQGFDGVVVFADIAGQNPETTELSMGELK